MVAAPRLSGREVRLALKAGTAERFAAAYMPSEMIVGYSESGRRFHGREGEPWDSGILVFRAHTKTY